MLQKRLLYFPIFLINILLITISCSSDSNSPEEEEMIAEDTFAITEITPNTGFAGDEITLKWEGFSETITQYAVTFNGVTAEIISTGTAELVCVIPENAATGLVSLRLNDTEVTSNTNFIVQETPPLSFSVSSTSTDALRPGYTMRLFGDGFGMQAENIAILFPTSNDNGMATARVLNVSNTELELAIPVNAISGEMEMTINEETLLYSVTLESVQHKKIYYFRGGRLHSFSEGTDGLLTSISESSGFPGDLAEIHSLTYSPTDNIFFGFSSYSSGVSDVLKFMGFDDTTNQRYTGLLCSQNFGCLEDHSGVVNTLTNKKYAFYHNNNYTFYVHEVDNFGNTIVEESTFTSNGYVATHFEFISHLNSFIALNDYGNHFRIHKIDATTFQYESFNIGDGVLQFSGENEFSELVYDKYQNRLFYSRKNNIYSIDLTNNTVTNLNTDFYSFVDADVNAAFDSSYKSINAIYHEPTNEIYLRLYSAPDDSNRAKIFAVNVASGQTRRIESSIGFSFGNTDRVYQWAVKP